MQSMYTYGADGACAAARAVLAHVQQGDGIEESWSKEYHRYLAAPTVSRWENCREQGYVISLRSADYSRQINIAFFEHRNSDAICAVLWEQTTINAPTIDTIPESAYPDKYSVSHSVPYDCAYKMAQWILERLVGFWVEADNRKEG